MDIDWTHLSSESVTRPGIPLGVVDCIRGERGRATIISSSCGKTTEPALEREREKREREREDCGANTRSPRACVGERALETNIPVCVACNLGRISGEQSPCGLHTTKGSVWSCCAFGTNGEREISREREREPLSLEEATGRTRCGLSQAQSEQCFSSPLIQKG